MYTRFPIRYREYNYSTPGAYFITAVTERRLFHFGFVKNGHMQLNAAGKMIQRWYEKLPQKFPDIICDEYVIMPNHFHAIIHIAPATVGSGPCARTQRQKISTSMDIHHRYHTTCHKCPIKQCGQTPWEMNQCFGNSLKLNCPKIPNDINQTQLDNPIQSIFSDNVRPRGGEPTVNIFDVVGWFKTMTTNEYIRHVKRDRWPRFYKRFWQLRFWDHIIRDERDYCRIRDYIIANPSKWDCDRFR